ncbi:hypothetical protein A134_23155 [Vibrio crassostreae 9CS106]|uniref:Uncharacterized protein n=1 Tax=Vibrio crassostreae 9CS106 TaxID=1191300 RepID=A0A1B1C3B4_9VIBR|nr:hypothetical protein A134_23155 [Vibrio crassostreae 9CS106]
MAWGDKHPWLDVEDAKLDAAGGYIPDGDLTSVRLEAEPWGYPEGARVVKGTYKYNNVAAKRQMFLVSTEALPLKGTGVLRHQVLDETYTDPVTGQYQLMTTFKSGVVVVAVDDYGKLHREGVTALVGDTIRPQSIYYIGLVYRCTKTGLVGSAPDWTAHHEGDTVKIGEAEFLAEMYSRPLVHGVLFPEETEL